MKKAILFLLFFAVLLSCVSCSYQQPVQQSNQQPTQEQIQLTKENIEKYVSIDDRVIDCTIEINQKYILGMLYNTYDDCLADVQISVNKKSSKYSFENLTIKLKLKSYVSTLGTEPTWEFKNGNQYDGNYNYKIVTFNIPYDGEYTHNEKLVINESLFYATADDPKELTYISIEIVEVSGTVIIEN